jgi:hypothetical protein
MHEALYSINCLDGGWLCAREGDASAAISREENDRGN